MRMFLRGTISPWTICKVSIILSQQRGTECLHDKNWPAFAGFTWINCINRDAAKLTVLGAKIANKVNTLISIFTVLIVFVYGFAYTSVQLF